MNKREKEALKNLVIRLSPLPIGTKVKVKGWNWIGTICSVHFDFFLKEYAYQIRLKDGIVGWFTLAQLEVISFD